MCQQCRKVQCELIENFANKSVCHMWSVYGPIWNSHTHKHNHVGIHTTELASCICIHFSFIFIFTFTFILSTTCLYIEAFLPPYSCPTPSWLPSVSSLYVFFFFYWAILSFLINVCAYVFQKWTQVSSKNFQCQLIAKYPKNYVMDLLHKGTHLSMLHWANWADA